MSGGKVTVKGAIEVQRTLEQLSEDVENLDELGPDAGRLVQSAAQGLARVASGAMRSSIRIAPHTGGATIVAGEGLGIYPVVQEYGSSRRGISPNRFMRGAQEQQEPRVIDLFDREVSRMADKVKGA